MQIGIYGINDFATLYKGDIMNNLDFFGTQRIIAIGERLVVFHRETVIDVYAHVLVVV